jgi:hypothetical protein
MLDQAIIQDIFNRIAARRASDQQRSRNSSALCYCYSVKTQELYVGYSGAGSVVVSSQESAYDKQRRLARVGPVLKGTTQTLNHAIENCAEVAALNNALAYDEMYFDLVFATDHSLSGIIPPCAQCKQRINERCFGYIDRGGRFELGAVREAWQPGGERDRY